MHITNQKLSFDIFTVGHFETIATNIPVRLMTGFVLQGHKYVNVIVVYLAWNKCISNTF